MRAAWSANNAVVVSLVTIRTAVPLEKGKGTDPSSFQREETFGTRYTEGTHCLRLSGGIHRYKKKKKLYLSSCSLQSATVAERQAATSELSEGFVPITLSSFSKPRPTLA